MFPLGTVLLPGAYLSLHVFEPATGSRAGLLDGTPEFGVALIERGARWAAATVASTWPAWPASWRPCRCPTAGGPWARWAPAHPGRRWLDDGPYPLADVTPWPDPPAGRPRPRPGAPCWPPHGGCSPSRPSSARRWRRPRWTSTRTRRGHLPAGVVAPIGPMDRLAVLSAPGPDERAALLGRLLEEAVELAEPPRRAA